jgi:hypothetical protein
VAPAANFWRAGHAIEERIVSDSESHLLVEERDGVMILTMNLHRGVSAAGDDATN